MSAKIRINERKISSLLEYFSLRVIVSSRHSRKISASREKMQACLILFSSLSLGIEIRQAHLCSRSCVSCNFPRRRLISRVNSCSFSKKRIALSIGTAVCSQEKGCSSLCKELSVFPVSSIQLSFQAYSLAISGEISPETFSMQLHFCHLAGFMRRE